MPTATVEAPAKLADALYWFGTLPATEPVDVMIPTRDKDSANKDYYKIEKHHPWALWNISTLGEEARLWVGKCRFFQSIGAGSLECPAFSEIVQRTAANEAELSRIPYPGKIATLARTDVAKIIKAAYRQIIRYPLGVENMMKLQRGVHKINLDCFAKPASWTDEQWHDHQMVHTVPSEPVFDASTDVYVAHFIYLVELDKASPTLIRQMRFEPEKHISEAIQFLPHMMITENFFKDPPKSIAQMYGGPQGAK